MNGGPLPALLWYDQTAGYMDADMHVLSGSIELRPDSTYRHTSVSSMTIATPSSSGVLAESRWRMSGFGSVPRIK